LPAMSLRDVAPTAVASALNNVLSRNGLNVAKESGSVGPRNTEVFVLYRRRPELDRGPTAFESFQLAPYLEFQSVDDVVGAIRSAWELNPANQADALQVKYHQATNLLLVSGSRDALATAAKVVDTLKRVPAKTGDESTALPAKSEAPDAKKPDPISEAARMKQWTTEIERRRGLRDSGVQPPTTNAPAPAKK
jgi:hypothetical protein